MPPQQRKQQLLDAALEVILRDGYDKLSVGAIARTAEVTRPVVYGAYDGLRPLLLALLDRQQARALAQLAEVMPDEADLTETDTFILRTVSGLIDKVSADPLTWRPILLPPEGAPREVRERIEADRQRLLEQVTTLIRAGLGERGAQLDAELASHATVALLEHFGKLVLSRPDDFTRERLLSGVRALLAAFGI